MATVETPVTAFDNLAELVEYLGDIPLDRIRMKPLPGTATEKDVLAAEREPRKRLCELIDGVLVEKAMGIRESLLAGVIVRLIGSFVAEHDLGAVFGADGMLRLCPGRVRIPDVTFISWERIPGEEVPDVPIADFTPDLAVEVISRTNTAKEMERKLRDYFQAGAQVVWLVYPRTQTAEVYTAPTEKRRIAKTGSLDGGSLLPGFTLPLKQLFAEIRPRKRR